MVHPFAQNFALWPSVGVTAPSPSDFHRLFGEHHDFVWRSLRHFGVPEATVDDALQEVFLVVHRRFADYGSQFAFRSWLYGIAAQVARTHRRSDFRSERRKEIASTPVADEQPDEALARKRAGEFVGAFLQTLDAHHREVFVLMEVEGFTAPEVEQATGAKLNTIYARLRRVRLLFSDAIAANRGITERISQ